MTTLDLTRDERSDYEDMKRRQHRRRDDDVVRIRWSMIFQVIGYVLGLFVIYNSVTNRMTSAEERVNALQRDVASLQRDLAEVRADVKTLLRRAP